MPDRPYVANSEDRERMLDVWLGLTGQAPLPRGPLILPVLSGSMRPAIEVGSRIRIAAAAAAECRVGDVVVYIEDERLVAHRILWRMAGRLFVKGDANRHGHWVLPRRVKGIVREVLPAEDRAGAFPGKDPYSMAAARASRRQYLRDTALAVPRLIRSLITGRRPGNGDTP